ncbi:uncharacterized protein PG998_006230 [Apiospora kogelbergensis]|uniref:uncharacterized protein n=1 Tax=Apiospora kogelbergensis TaxID=1337665 RepID=UPI0031313871
MRNEYDNVLCSNTSSSQTMEMNEKESEGRKEIAMMATPPAASEDRHDDGGYDAAAQYFADTFGTLEDETLNGMQRIREGLRIYAIEALKYLEVGDILLLRRQARAALDCLDSITMSTEKIQHQK